MQIRMASITTDSLSKHHLITKSHGITTPFLRTSETLECARIFLKVINGNMCVSFWNGKVYIVIDEMIVKKEVGRVINKKKSDGQLPTTLFNGGAANHPPVCGLWCGVLLFLVSVCFAVSLLVLFSCLRLNLH